MSAQYKKIFFGFLVSTLLFLIGYQISSIFSINASMKRYDVLRQKNVESSTQEHVLTTETVLSSEWQTPTQYVFKENVYKKWLELNGDFVGWLKIGGTQVDYPVVRGDDNETYLNRDFLNKSSKAGAIFMDYRNIGQFSDRHTVIYGHYMKDGSMFGDLHLYKSEAFYKENMMIEMSGLYEEKSYTIFSVTIEQADDYEIDLKLSSDDYLKQILNASIYNTKLIPGRGVKLLTLVTCSYEIDNGRILIHAFENE